MQESASNIKEWYYDENDPNSMLELKNFERLFKHFQLETEANLDEVTDPLRLKLLKINNTGKLIQYNKTGLLRQLDFSKKDISHLQLEYDMKIKYMQESYSKIKSALEARINLIENMVSEAI